MIKDFISLEQFRNRLTHIDALPQLVIIGILSGIATGLVMVLFRLIIELPLSCWLPSGNAEGFESLPGWARFALPVSGSLLLFALLSRLAPESRRVGVVHVLDRMSYHQGNLPGRNIVVQFFAASIALLSGHPVGREGPAIHLGAGCSSLIGQHLQLPNNSIRILVGCGTAAAIAAAFNTPLAGIIFAMEVVMLEYTVVGFTPVIVAAVSADITMRAIVGPHFAISVPAMQLQSLAELPWVMLLGLLIGFSAAGFNLLARQPARIAHWPLGIRLLLAGVLTGAVAQYYPQVMGIGYDTLDQVLNGQIGLGLLCGLFIAKWMLTPLVLGLGIPAGLIGPALFIGAIAGAIIGLIGHQLAPVSAADSGMYAMLGMGAMMGAVLNAPLAALIALLELTGNPNIILPAMLAIVISNLTVRQLFGMPSIFISNLRAQGLDYQHDALTQALSRSAVGSMMSTNILCCNPLLETNVTTTLLAEQPDWIVIENEGQHSLLEPDDLKLFIDQTEQDNIDLLEIPARRRDLSPISFRATLKEALDQMNDHGFDAVLVLSNQGQTIGVLTREQLEHNYYRKQTS
ncbi:chloride channel protein [Marinobacterium jannaschii]|uniref:chloride channel protein n=1 Tax=Marinobacterium jannaschii TaxID=64970 RepID=UPI00047F0E60|nr:chloride channel protein [Marinobacterium jannaschii]